jgi:hypothetical protein
LTTVEEAVSKALKPSTTGLRGTMLDTFPSCSNSQWP